MTMTTFKLPVPEPCPCGSRYARVEVIPGDGRSDGAALWVCAGCGGMNKINVPGTIPDPRLSRTEIDHLKREYLPKAPRARLYGLPVADMSRDELLAIAVWFCERECDRYRDLLRITRDDGTVLR